jgi:hypothetical protein
MVLARENGEAKLGTLAPRKFTQIDPVMKVILVYNLWW